MKTPISNTATCIFIAIASCAAPAFAQNTAPDRAAAAQTPAATPANNYGLDGQLPANRGAAYRNSEQTLLGAPNPYGDDGAQGNTDDRQRTALLDEQRMTVMGGQGAQPAPGKGQRKVPAAGNGQVRVAGQPGRPNAADGLTPEGAVKNTYADPYDAGKRGVYRSPW